MSQALTAAKASCVPREIMCQECSDSSCRSLRSPVSVQVSLSLVSQVFTFSIEKFGRARLHDSSGNVLGGGEGS